jgi:LTXXQ motif family protein
MRKLSRALAVTLLAASIPATVVLAQQADEPSQPTAEQGDKGRGPSPETQARLEDGRIAMVKAALKLTPDQEKLWAPVEEKIRAGFEERRKAREEWRSKREERRAEHDKNKSEKLALPDRIEKRSERMVTMATKLNERAAKTKELAETLKPFYASLSDEQKQVAGLVLGRMVGGHHHGHGRRWAMGGGMGDGMMGHHHDKHAE